jgi:hypothetical protein
MRVAPTRHGYRPDEWAESGEVVDTLLTLMREHAKTCENPTQYCMGCGTGAPSTHPLMRSFTMLLLLDSGELTMLLHRALARVIGAEAGHAAGSGPHSG